MGLQPQVQLPLVPSLTIPSPVAEDPTDVGRRHPRWLLDMWRRGFRFLFLLDGIGLYASMLAINYARFGREWPTYPRSHYLIGFAIATVIHLLIGYFVGLYEREMRLGQRPWLSRVILAMTIGVAVEGLAFVVLDRYLMPRLNLFVLLVVGSAVLTANRIISRTLSRRRLGAPRVFLVGSDSECESAVAHLAETGGAVRAIGASRSADQLLTKIAGSGATDVLLLSPSSYAAIFPQPLNDLERDGVGVFQRVSAPETLLGLHEICEVGGMPFVSLQARSLPAHKYRLKRVVDLSVLAAFSPVILIVALATTLYVRVLAGSPVLYRQVRVGRSGVPFEMVKFRTMHADAESSGAVLSTTDDPRVVRGLGWLRSTRLDEIPQLWHVLLGQMSIVGPRPERPEFTEQLGRRIPGYERRFEMPPGLTGLAQIHGRYSTDAEYKIGYDLQYLADWTLVLDVQIMIRTVWVVLSRRV
jgi:exopolysaccharide biosynthesis polyprenyl glycosylphosphotransferase